MFEYRLGFVGDEDVYVLQMREGNVLSAEKGRYEIVGDELRLIGIHMLVNAEYTPSASRISAALAGSGLLFYFRPTGESPLDRETLDALLESGEEAASDPAPEGWPQAVPAPDFGGEIETDSGYGTETRTIKFQNIDPERLGRYLQTLREAGFEVTEERDVLVDARVDENGNAFYTHVFEAVNGEIRDYGTFSRLETGYAIRIGYSLQKQYDKDSGGFVSNPYARLVLYVGWENR